MAASSRASTELLIPRKWQEEEASPERTKIWKIGSDVRVPVVYYISRNGRLEHPHFIEVPLSSSQGLYLRDVMNRLNILRGEGMAKLYSWSSKRRYKNGFVWQDLTEDDLIPPTHGQEYVLKGSELLRSSMSFRYCEPTDSSETTAGTKTSGGKDLPATTWRRNQSWSSFDHTHEYIVYKPERCTEVAEKSSDASTQTGHEQRRTRSDRIETTPELNREEYSTPGSEVLEGMSESNTINQSAEVRDRTISSECSSGRLKASRVLKQLVTCGSASMRVDRGGTKVNYSRKNSQLSGEILSSRISSYYIRRITTI
ncbi:hypothetical protein NMG60_11012518 [Bertholletia excelsa]